MKAIFVGSTAAAIRRAAAPESDSAYRQFGTVPGPCDGRTGILLIPITVATGPVLWDVWRRRLRANAGSISR